MIRLDTFDINQLRELRIQHHINELAFIVNKTSISIIKGEYEGVGNIPLGLGIIGHTHPPAAEYLYNPPSETDVIAAMDMPDQDWFIIDELGIWVYCIPFGTEKIDTDKIDLLACAIMNNEIDVDQYLEDINKYIIVTFYLYKDDPTLILKKI